MEINIEDIKKAHDVLTDLNRCALADITFCEDGVPVEIDPKLLKDFKFLGLSNKDFITTGFYKRGWDEEETT